MPSMNMPGRGDVYKAAPGLESHGSQRDGGLRARDAISTSTAPLISACEPIDDVTAHTATKITRMVVRSRFDEAVAAMAAVDGGWLGQFGAAQLDDELRNDERGAAGVCGRHGRQGRARRAFGALVAPKGK